MLDPAAPFDAQKFGRALMALWPHGDSRIPGLRAAMIEQAPQLFAQYEFTVLAWADQMGEFTEECNGGEEIEENLNYRASVLHSQWPSHFTAAQALQMQHNPRAIANQAYNGRMGNRWGTDDGWNYRGRGPAQTTGREAYGLLGEHMKLDLVSRPELINTAEHFLTAGVIDFVEICGCLPYAKRDDEVNETRHLNGALIGLAQRKASIRLWKREMGLIA